jgi:Tfp pilus assembly protein PilF
MLKDLESRNNRNTPAQELLEGHTDENRGGRNRKPLVLIALLLVPILGYLGWERIDSPNAQPSTQSVKAVAVAPTPAAPKEVPPPTPVATVSEPVSAPVTPLPLVAPAEPADTLPPPPQLLSIKPQQLTGSWDKQRLTLKGRNLQQENRLLVSWGGNRKILPAERITWRDSTTLEVEIITGTQANEWSVALVDGEGDPLQLTVVAPQQEIPVQRTESVAEVEEDEPTPGAAIEKRIRPLRPEQRAELAYEDGYTRLQRGDRAGAEAAWRKAFEHEPRHIASREGLAGLYLSQGRRVEAGELLAEGLVHHPGYGQFALLSARLQVENGETAAALVTLEKALESRSQGAEFLAFLAAVYQRQKSFDKSVAAYQHALSQQPRNGTWWMGLGISQEGAGKYGEAITAYNEAKNSGNLPPRLVQYVEGRLGVLQEK